MSVAPVAHSDTVYDVKLLSDPLEGRTPYAATCCLDAVCQNEECSAAVLIDNDDDLYFTSALLGETIYEPAIILNWNCPVCGTPNAIEEWLLADAHSLTWPQPLTNEEADSNPASVLISVSARRAALERYETGK